MNASPFVRLPRGFESEDWWRAVPMAARCIAVLLIGQASYKSETSRGVSIEPGQLVSTQRELAEASGATRSQVRTAIAALERVGFLKAEATSSDKKAPTLFSIVNWQRFIYPDKNWRGNDAKKEQSFTKSEGQGSPKESPKESPCASPAPIGFFSIPLPKQSPKQSPTRDISRERTELSELYRTNKKQARDVTPGQPALDKRSSSFSFCPDSKALPQEGAVPTQATCADALPQRSEEGLLAIRQAEALLQLQRAMAGARVEAPSMQDEPVCVGVQAAASAVAAWAEEPGPKVVPLAQPQTMARPAPGSSGGFAPGGAGGLDASEFAAMAMAWAKGREV